MTWPTLTVRIATSAQADAFTLDDTDKGRLANPPTVPGYKLGDTFGKVWSEVTDDVRSDVGVSITRGSTRQQGPYFVFEAGRLSFTLDDRSGDYDSLNLAGPYVVAGVSQLLPGLPVQVQATYQGTTFQLFTGYVDSWNKTYPGEGTTDSVVQVTASDPAAYLTKANPAEQAEQGAGEYVHARLDRVLDNVRWPADQRKFDDIGLWTMSATTLSTEVWTELQNTATSTNGYLFMDVDGNVVYRDRSSFPRTNDFTVGEGKDIPVVGLQLANDWDQVYNVVKLQRQDGALQTVEDETSKALFGMRSFSRTDSLLDTDNQVADTADFVLFQSRTQQLRLDAVTMEPDDTYSADQWTTLLNLELLQRVGSELVTTDGRTVENDGLVRGVSLDVEPYRWRWSVSTTAAPTELGDFVLDNGALGLLADYSATEIATIRAYYEWLTDSGIDWYFEYPGPIFAPVSADFVFTVGIAAEQAMGDNYYAFSRFIRETVNSTQSITSIVQGIEDWNGTAFADFPTTATLYPTLCLF